VTKPTGTIYTSYGTFGSSSGGFDVGYGKQSWGNFISVDGLNTSRFLDPPEFAVFHDKAMRKTSSTALMISSTRQFAAPQPRLLPLVVPDAQYLRHLNVGGVNLAGTAVNGPTDQRSKIGTFNIAPSYTRVINQYSVFNLGVYLRKDNYHYYPSADPFADLGPIPK